VIFCSISEAAQEHPDLLRQYLGSVVPHTDNYYAALNAADALPLGGFSPDATAMCID